MNLSHLFDLQPKSLKGIKERSAYASSHELALPPFKVPITGEQAREALKRSRARREANGTT